MSGTSMRLNQRLFMNTQKLRPLVAATFISIALGACSSAPKEIESLEQARYDYNEAAQDVTVARHAPEQLDHARDALSAADSRWKKKDDKSSIEHYVYLTKQRVRIAKLISDSNEADRELEEMALERRNVTLDLREAELVRAKQEAQNLQSQIAELQALQAMQAEKTERGIVLTLGDVLFDSGEATLASTAARNIDKIASFMIDNPERQAVIEGHTDNRGDDDFNMDLSRDRAFAVLGALLNAGVSSSRISTEGFGEGQPVANNDTREGRQQNRRVEIIFPDVVTVVSELDE